MIGFTRDEIRHFYLDYLKLGVSYEKHIEVSSVTDADVEDLLDRMAEQYDGYCFDEFYKNKVFSTYSVNRFLLSLSQKKCTVFGDYWYEAGGLPSILKNYLQSHNLDADKLLVSDIVVNLNDFLNPTTLPSMDENVLMCQTGYLTLKSELSSSRYAVKVGLANLEVGRAMSKLLTIRLVSEDFLLKSEALDLNTASVEELIGHFNELLASVAYDKYPVNSEMMLRALLQFYLMGKGVDVRVEQHNSKGRSDLIVNFKKRRVVIELKFSKDGRNSEALLKEAVNQIRAKEYGVENLGSRELLKIACVFNGADDRRQITFFKQV